MHKYIIYIYMYIYIYVRISADLTIVSSVILHTLNRPIPSETVIIQHANAKPLQATILQSTKGYTAAPQKSTCLFSGGDTQAPP